MKRPLVKVVAAGIGAVILLGGCSFDKATEPFQDAPRSGVNDGPAEIITMPDGFNNLASKCDGPNRVYTTYHGDSAYGAPAVVANDPRCTG